MTAVHMMISMGNDVKFTLLCCLRQWRSKNMTSRFASLTDLDRARKIFGGKDSQNTKRSTKVAKELFADYVKEKKLREPEVLFPRLEMNYQFHLLSWPFFFRSMYNKTIIRFSFVISRKIEVSVKVIGRSLRLRLITPSSTLIILDVTKTSSNNCLLLVTKIYLTLK